MMQQTSLLAWLEVQPKLGDKQRIVLSALKEKPMCNQDLAAKLSWPINTITPRIMELRQKKLVVEHNKARSRETGRLVIYWRAA